MTRASVLREGDAEFVVSDATIVVGVEAGELGAGDGLVAVEVQALEFGALAGMGS